jgi:IS30 family transposase
MSTYRQLSLEERYAIARLREAGQSIRQIAAAVDRQPSTIARELKRNSGAKIGYRPSYAQQQTEARRWTGTRLDRDDTLRETILDRLAEGRSPEQVAGRLAREAGRKVISHETIYRFIYAQLKRTNDRRWRHYLPRAKYKRGWRTKGGWPRHTDRLSIHDRPAEIATRQHPGHWEADAMLFSSPGQAILVAHERRSRLTIAVRQNSLKADPVAAALTRLLRPVPPDLRQSITFDNGTEFTRHQRIAHQLGVQTFFCDPRAPWQKGGVENAIGRLRRNLPRKTDITALPHTRLDAILAAHNNTPRKCLVFQTPAEAFLQPLHFECESTPGSSPG